MSPLFQGGLWVASQAFPLRAHISPSVLSHLLSSLSSVFNMDTVAELPKENKILLVSMYDLFNKKFCIFFIGPQPRLMPVMSDAIE